MKNIQIGDRVYYRESPISIESMRALNIWTEEAIQLFYDSWVQQQGMATVAAIYPQVDGQPTIYDLNLNGVQIVAEESEISEVNQS